MSLAGLQRSLLADAPSALFDPASLDHLVAALAGAPAAALGYASAPRVAARAIRCTDLAATPSGAVTVSLFELGAGARMAAHGHPGAVLTRVLCGTVRVAAWTREGGAVGGAASSFSGTWRLSRNMLACAGDVMLTGVAAAGGAHAVHAVRQEGAEAAVMLDVLLPGYGADGAHIYASPQPLDGEVADCFAAAEGSRWALRGPHGAPGLAEHSAMSTLAYQGRRLDLR